MLEQENVDQVMLDLDGTENKCMIFFIYLIFLNGVEEGVCLWVNYNMQWIY